MIIAISSGFSPQPSKEGVLVQTVGGRPHTADCIQCLPLGIGASPSTEVSVSNMNLDINKQVSKATAEVWAQEGAAQALSPRPISACLYVYLKGREKDREGSPIPSSGFSPYKPSSGWARPDSGVRSSSWSPKWAVKLQVPGPPHTPHEPMCEQEAETASRASTPNLAP